MRYLNAKAAPWALPGVSTTAPSFAYDVALSYFHEDDDEEEEGDNAEGEEEVEDETPDEEEGEEVEEEEDGDSHFEGMEASA